MRWDLDWRGGVIQGEGAEILKGVEEGGFDYRRVGGLGGEGNHDLLEKSKGPLIQEREEEYMGYDIKAYSTQKKEEIYPGDVWELRRKAVWRKGTLYTQTLLDGRTPRWKRGRTKKRDTTTEV